MAFQHINTSPNDAKPLIVTNGTHADVVVYDEMESEHASRPIWLRGPDWQEEIHYYPTHWSELPAQSGERTRHDQ